jgi:hypothetical protein
LVHQVNQAGVRYAAGLACPFSEFVSSIRALARLTKYEPSLSHYATALMTHPVDEVRVAAAAIGSLDDTAQHAFAEDPSPAVRATLASRATELSGNVLAALQADEHLDVKRALAAALPFDQATPNT